MVFQEINLVTASLYVDSHDSWLAGDQKVIGINVTLCLCQ